MYKLTLAVAALLGVLDTQAIQIEQKADLDMMEVETDEVLTADAEAWDDPDEESADFEQLPQEDKELVETELDEELSSACSAGIRRWSTSANSLSAWKRAERGSRAFVDSQFAGWSALYTASTVGNGRIKSTVQRWRKRITGWARPAETQQQRRRHKGVAPSLWGKFGKPRPEGITQQSLGDCWFLAAASAVAERPDRITRIVQNTRYSKNGAFRFYFWVENRWVGINIDDRLPVSRGRRKSILFTQPSRAGGAWWMPLMEKAFAKLDQDYSRISGGVGYEGLRTLTGMPTTAIRVRRGPTSAQIDALWKLVKPLAQKDYPMTTSCCHSRTPYGGLYSGHAYTLLNLVELSNGQKLAVIRNPHNAEKYKGAWHDGDRRWTSAYKEEAGYVGKSNDGLFYMPWEKYATNFRRISVSLYQSYGGYTQKSKSQSGRTMVYYITNPTEQEMYVNVEGVNSRNVPRTCELDSKWVSELRYPSGSRVGDSPDAQQRHSSRGWTFNGKIGKVPAGKYKLLVQKRKGRTAKYTINVYWKDKKGTVS